MGSRRIFLAMTYGAILVLGVIYFKEVAGALIGVLRLFLPFFLGLVFAFVLNHPCEKLTAFWRRLGVGERYVRFLGIAGVYLLLLCGAAAIVVWIAPQFAANMGRFARRASAYLDEMQALCDRLCDFFHLERLDLEQAPKLLETYASRAGDSEDWIPRITDTTHKMLAGAVNILVGIVFSIYLLGGKRRLIGQMDRLFRAFFPEDAYKVLRYLTGIAVQTFDNYVVGQSLEAAILGGLCFAGMTVLRIGYAGMISVIVAVTALIPIVGATVGGIASAALLFMASPGNALLFLIFFLILQQIENNLIYPRVVGKRIGLPGIWVLLGITVGAKAAGVAGMLFGVPLLTVCYTLLGQIVRIVEEWKQLQRENGRRAP